MPNPQVGSGALVNKGSQIFAYAVYIAASSSGATYPSNKLGAASEPTGGWLRVGRLVDDQFAEDVGDPDIFKARAGWNRSIQFQAVRQAEDAKWTFRLDESDPDTMMKFRNTTATSLSSGSNTGQEAIYKTGQSYGAKVLVVGVAIDPNSTRERHLYVGKSLVTFKPVREDTYEGFEMAVQISDTSSTETVRRREWD